MKISLFSQYQICFSPLFFSCQYESFLIDSIQIFKCRICFSLLNFIIWCVLKSEMIIVAPGYCEIVVCYSLLHGIIFLSNR